MIIHVVTCECGEQFRSRNKAYAYELRAEHAWEGSSLERYGHKYSTHTTVDTPDIVNPEPKWRPADA